MHHPIAFEDRSLTALRTYFFFLEFIFLAESRQAYLNSCKGSELFVYFIPLKRHIVLEVGQIFVSVEAKSKVAQEVE